MEKKSWTIGIGGSNADGVDVLRVIGTEEQIKEYLFDLIQEEREEVAEGYFDYYESGTEDISELEVRSYGRIYGYNCFSDYHTDYEAIPDDIIEIKEL